MIANLCHFVGSPWVWTPYLSMENPPSVPISSLRRANCELQGFIAFLLDLKEDQASEIGDWQCGGGFFVLKRQQLLHFLKLLRITKCHLETCSYLHAMCTEQIHSSEIFWKKVPISYICPCFLVNSKAPRSKFLLFLLKKAQIVITAVFHAKNPVAEFLRWS